MSKPLRMSRQKYDELKQELRYLKNEGLEIVNQHLKEARAFGDLSENSEYDEARNDQAKLYARMTELDAMLENCEIIAGEESIEEGTVGMGSVVTIYYGNDEEDTDCFTIVGSGEADPMNGKMSDESIIGKAVFGRHIGETVTYVAPQGKMTCTIKAIEN